MITAMIAMFQRTMQVEGLPVKPFYRFLKIYKSLLKASTNPVGNNYCWENSEKLELDMKNIRHSWPHKSCLNKLTSKGYYMCCFTVFVSLFTI
ncbi:hypothetical protein QR46_4732 [Giardia duodenalis assemblage B]|uniref:Uncharacterized protein n=1 Tax=Giardia duodenalis assemblage B TaxID=1394984 RepID=A0A132NMK0_GIAIN|nr:hypothetical protein QR46_4732 [Giardia intestinalis assemblage B]